MKLESTKKTLVRRETEAGLRESAAAPVKTGKTMSQAEFANTGAKKPAKPMPKHLAEQAFGKRKKP